MGYMKKKLLSIILAVSLAGGAIGAYTYFHRDTAYVFAAEFRDGYKLEPTKVDAAGVKTDSHFRLTTEEGVILPTAEELREGMKIQPEVAFEVDAEEAALLLRPTEALKENTVYIFSYKEITWAYKTEASFALLGTLPRNQSTNVPVRSGIEFVFNYAGAQVEDYFSIVPEVKGRFEDHGKVVAFVPKDLEEQTVYTVTLKKGLPLGNSDKALEEDYIFQFETEAKDSNNSPYAYLSFQSITNEFRSDEAPVLFWDFYSEDSSTEDENENGRQAKVNVYAYEQAQDYMEDLASLQSLPYWSYYGMAEIGVPTSGLNEVLDFEYEMDPNRTYPYALELPSSLAPGYYLVDASWREIHAQTFVQVTDLGFYYKQAVNEDLLWVHDLGSATALEGVAITAYDVLDQSVIETQRKGETDEKGLALIPRAEALETAELGFYHLQAQGKEAVLFGGEMNSYWYGRYNGYGSSHEFWQYFKPERNLYQPNDEVSFFGFLRSRYHEEEIQEVSVEIRQGGYYYFEWLPYAVDSLSYVKETLQVQNGFFEGRLQLPNLAAGGYELVLKYQGKEVATTYLTVEDYIKPSYKIEIEKSKKAIFVDESVDFMVKTLFYEGTPVSYLDYQYNISGNEYLEDAEKTDQSGVGLVTFKPNYQAGIQGEQYFSFSAYAQLPESGNIYANESLRVFFNDINVDARASLDGEKGSVDVKINAITLERINQSDEEYSSDYLAEPKSGWALEGTIYRNEWIKEEAGEYYDYINKIVQTQYTYHLETTEFQKVSLLTDEKGEVNVEVDLPKKEHVYYTMKLLTQDQKLRNMEYELYFGDYGWYYPSDSTWYHLQADQEFYSLDQKAKVQFMNNEEALDFNTDPAEFLFFTAQNGILSSEVQTGTAYELDFIEAYIPNLTVSAVWFNGRTYLEASSVDLRYAYQDENIVLEVLTDQESYMPGEEIELQFLAKDEEGAAMSGGRVNFALVDEALFSLSDMSIDPLSELYVSVRSGLFSSYISHQNQNTSFGGGFYGGVKESATEATTSMDLSMDGATPVYQLGRNEEESASSQTYIRSEFKDTAYFATVVLDENGKGQIRISLPDNVTSWRLTAAALTSDLKAGSEVVQVKVSLPFFMNTSLSSVYLVGDKPSIGVTSYGASLEKEEAIDYRIEVYRDNELVHEETADGKAFERSNLSLGELEVAATYQLKILASREDGSSDGMQQEFKVLETYHQEEVSEYLSVVADLQLEETLQQAVDSGNIRLSFMDKGRAYYLNPLYQLSYANGKRIDQKVVAAYVQNVLQQEFNQDIQAAEVSVNEYFTPEGGLAVLPYGNADLETTVKMLPVLLEQASVETIRYYLENAWYSDTVTDKAMILYGLSLLDQPILDDLENYSRIEELSVKERLYVALAYMAVGDTFMANKSYTMAVAGVMKELDQVAYLDFGAEEKNLELTAIAMVCAAKLDLPVSNLFYEYVSTRYSNEVLNNVWVLQYVLEKIERLEKTEASFSYEYLGQKETVDLSTGEIKSFTLPIQTLPVFDLPIVNGDVGIVLNYQRQQISGVENDTDLSATRRYYSYQENEESTTFQEGDLVKVVIDYEVKKEAIDGSYILTDYLPSGLKPIDNPWSMGLATEGGYTWYREVDGQKVSFYIGHVDPSYYEPLVYYARIASIGEFSAEALIIQGSNYKDSRFIGETSKIQIQ